LWSSDHETFVFLAIEPDGPGYRLIAVENGQQRILLPDRIDRERGYLVPIGWTSNGELILLERYMLHNLREARIWQYDPATAELTMREIIPTPDLKGNSASLEDGWAFIGFDTVGVLGYLLNLDSGQLATFRTAFALQDPPPSVFELYPINILGIVDMSAFETWLAQLPPTETDAPIPITNPLNAPFLYWPLPDHERSITCYPDSEWTALYFDLECPGLATPRSYPGHEGTDIGGKPNGLSIGTQVYAAAHGLVVDTFSSCTSGDIPCGDAYGNFVLIEHTRVTNSYNTATWFTGYAHLQTILVEPFTYIEEIGVPIALSGDTGLGGAHLHFEVRSAEQLQASNRINPWDDRFTSDGDGLWIGGNAHPISAVEAHPPPILLICQTTAGNNIRSGPGIAYDVVDKSIDQTDYEVFQIQSVDLDQAPGDWYHIRWQDSGITGWMWSDLMNDCISAASGAEQ
jgi:murein DD-endopeptidase MepM/ murein hydrolase activator NlpD